MSPVHLALETLSLIKNKYYWKSLILTFKGHGHNDFILIWKKILFELEVKGEGQNDLILICDTLPSPETNAYEK